MLVAYRSNFRTDEGLETALDLATGAAAKALGLVPDSAARGLCEGAPADFVTIEAETIAEAVVSRPPRRHVVKGGGLVAQDGSLV